MAQMATMTADFVAAISLIAIERLKYFRDYPVRKESDDDRYYSPYQNDYYRERREKEYVAKQKERAVVINYLAALANKDHVTMDELLTRLRKMKYERYDFFAGTNFTEGYFLATTRPLFMSATNGDVWDIGRYTIQIPVLSVINRALEQVKMRPILFDGMVEQVTAYHPHHTRHSTCWSEWGPNLVQAFLNVNFDLMFGMLLGFLQSYYPGSPLARPPYGEVKREPGRDMYWMRQLSQAEIKQLKRR